MRLQKPGNISFRGIPAVSVCIRGDADDISSVLDNGKNGTPTLILKGSGKASDLISDCQTLRYSPRHKYHKDPTLICCRQKQLQSFLTTTARRELLVIEGADRREEYGCYDFSDITECLQKVKVWRDSVRIQKRWKEEAVRLGPSTSKSLLEIENWVYDYKERAKHMKIDFYGVTKMEEKEIQEVKELRIDLIKAFCESHGLQCHVAMLQDESIKLGLYAHKAHGQHEEAPYRSPQSGHAPPLARGPTRGSLLPSIVKRSSLRPSLVPHAASHSLARAHSHAREENKDEQEEEARSCLQVIADSSAASSAAEAFFEAIDIEATKICKLYDLDCDNACNVIHEAIAAVTTNRLWVYELNNALSQNFETALLSCMLWSWGHPMYDDQENLHRKLSLAIVLRRSDVLEEILSESGLRNPILRAPVLRRVMTEAIALNNVGIVRDLLHHGANVDGFAIPVLPFKIECVFLLKDVNEYLFQEPKENKLKSASKRIGKIAVIAKSTPDEQHRPARRRSSMKQILSEKQQEEQTLQQNMANWHELLKLSKDDNSDYVCQIFGAIKDAFEDKILKSVALMTGTVDSKFMKHPDFSRHKSTVTVTPFATTVEPMDWKVSC